MPHAQELNETHGVPVVAMGACLHNTDEPPGLGKREIMRGYRVCVAIENSNAQDYVSEKMWHAFEGGCVPIAMGAPNLRADFLPANDSALLVEDYPSVAELAAEVKRVLTDRAAWEARTTWRRAPYDSLNLGYRRANRIDELPHPRCQICQILADRKLQRLSNSTGGAAGPASR